MIELIMVITIIVVLAVVVAVTAGSGRLDGAANKLMSDLRYSQQLAISRQVECGIVFNPAANSYFAYINNTSTIATDPHTRGNLSINYDTESEYNGIDLASTNFGNQISFDYLGAPYDSDGDPLSGQAVVVLQQGSYTKTITIERNTGEIKIP